MGGIGSGRWCWHREKTTVEECRTLGALGHVRDGLLTAAPGTIWWSNAVTGERTASVGFRRSTVGGGVIFVLSYTVNRRGGDLHDVVLMVTHADDAAGSSRRALAVHLPVSPGRVRLRPARWHCTSRLARATSAATTTAVA